MRRYIPLILIEGATVMAVELCGAKLLAPIYGGSLFVWAAILAVTLAALAFGYYYGGVLSSKNEPQKKLFSIIILASCLIIVMPFIAEHVLSVISVLPLQIAVSISSILLIFFPIFFLGCTTPLLIRINTVKADDSGLISGKIYAISTVGGICSTLLCGFYLIPNWGLTLTLITFALLLFITVVLILKIFKANSYLMVLASVLLSISSVLGNEKDVLFKKQGVMGEIEVIDLHVEGRKVRQLRVNKTVQSEIDLEAKRSTSTYISIIDSILKPGENKRAIVFGLGGGVLCGIVQQKKYHVIAVEFDNRIIKAAQDFFNSKVHTYNCDARAFINTSPAKEDCIILDLFKGEEQPFHVLTLECFKKLHSKLKGDSTMIINWHGYIDGELGKGTQILLNTLHKAGFETTLIPGPGKEDHRNTIILCKPVDRSEFDMTIPINTDDQPVIELANAKANLRWRKNYLRYYQSSR